MNHLDLFSGVGGFALAAKWVGWQTSGFVEIDPFCQKVLAKHWPGVQIESDIRDITGRTFPERPDIITGGFPCQPFSVAGKRRGTADDRHLWPEMVRVIKEYKPRWVLGENVAGIIPMELDSVLLDLEVAGYEAWPLVIPACGVDARHRRNRVWIVANSERPRTGGERREINDEGRRTSANWRKSLRQTDGPISASWADAASEDVAYPNEPRPQGRFSGELQERGTERIVGPSSASLAYTGEQQRNGGSDGTCWWSREPLEALRDARRRGRQEDGMSIPESLLGRVADGVPHRVDRLRSLGNAIVPLVAYEIFRAIELTRS